MLLMIGIFSAAVVIYYSLKDTFEKAAFTSHLSFGSSGELFWQTILQINLIAAGISVLIGMLVTILAHFYLESFFRSLAEGLKQLGDGDFSFRLKTKGRWWGGGLLNDFNKVAEDIKKNDAALKETLNDIILEINSRQQTALEEIKLLHSRLRQIKYF